MFSKSPRANNDLVKKLKDQVWNPFEKVLKESDVSNLADLELASRTMFDSCLQTLGSEYRTQFVRYGGLTTDKSC
jgi:hypothetical protein